MWNGELSDGNDIRNAFGKRVDGKGERKMTMREEAGGKETKNAKKETKSAKRGQAV
jgi:hypothetical protein